MSRVASRALQALLKIYFFVAAISAVTPLAAQETDQPALVIQHGQNAAISSIAFSPDGRWALIGDWLGIAALYSSETGMLLRRFGHSGNVNSVAFSPDGRSAVTGTSDGNVKLWDVRTGAELQHFTGHVGSVSRVIFFPGGRHILTKASDGTARIWDATTGAQLQEIGGADEEVRSIALSPDGGLVAVGLSDGVVRILDTGPARRQLDLIGHVGPVLSVAFSGSGRQLLSGGLDSIAILWDASTGKQIRRLAGHGKSVNSVVFSPDERFLITGASDSTVRVWKSDTGDNVVLKHTQSVDEVAYSPDGRFLVARGFTRLKLWDTVQNREGTVAGPAAADGGEPSPFSIAFSPDGKQLLTGFSDGTVLLLDADAGTVSDSFAENVGAVWAVAFSPDDRLVITGSDDGTAALWDLRTGTPLRRSIGHSDGVGNVAFSSDAGYVVTGGKQTARLWDTATGAEVRRFAGAGAVALSPDGRNVVTGADGTVQMWNANTGTKIQEFGKYREGLQSVAFSPDGRQLLVADYHYPVARLWDVSSGVELKMFVGAGEFSGVNSVAISPVNGALAVTGGRDGTVRLWDVRTGTQPVWSNRHEPTVMAAAFSPNGQYVVTAGADRTSRIWDVATAAELRRFEGPARVMTSVAMSSDTRWMLTGDGEGNTILWDAATGQKLARIVSFKDKTWVVVTPDGRFDTNNLEEVRGLHWVMPDDPMRGLPIEIFMRDYYEPRLLSRVLAGEKLPPVRPLAELNRVQPSVEIADVTLESCLPEPCAADTATVTIAVRNSSRDFQRDEQSLRVESGVYDLRLFRDGRLVRSAPALREPWENEAGLDWKEELERWRQSTQIELDKDGRAELIFKDIPFPTKGERETIEFTAYAFNVDKVKSATARTEPFSLPEFVIRPPKAYVVSIGISAYENPSWNLTYAAEDARVTAEVIEKSLRQTGRYQAEHIVAVPLISDIDDADGAATMPVTKARIKAVFDLLAGKTVDPEIRVSIPNAQRLEASMPDDLVLIAYSGHGLADERGDFHLFPYDIGSGDIRKVDNELFAKTVSSAELSVWLRDVDAGEMVMVVDACNSAASVEGGGFKPGPMGSRGLGQLAYDKQMRILAASQAEAVAIESEKLRHGLLTYALIREGLEAGRANREPEDQVIHLGEWLAYGAERVPVLYEELADGTFKSTRNYKGARPASGAGAQRKVQEPGLFDFARADGNVVLRQLSK